MFKFFPADKVSAIVKPHGFESGFTAAEFQNFTIGDFAQIDIECSEGVIRLRRWENDCGDYGKVIANVTVDDLADLNDAVRCVFFGESNWKFTTI